MSTELEDLPEGTRFTDVLEAVQAAWLAGDFVLARDLVQRYIDCRGEFCCMRCTAMREEPWRMNNHLGSFFVCPECATVVSQQRELLAGGGEMFMVGPVQKVSTLRTTRVGCATVQQSTTTIRRESLTIVKR